MHFLVVDQRFGTPIYVFLESDPHAESEYPGFAVREGTLEAIPPALSARRCSIGRDPDCPEQFREFASDGAVTRAGFTLMEPRYVGANWEGYCRHFRPEGERPARRPAPPPHPGRVG